MLTSSLDNLFESLTIDSDLFSSGPKPPLPMVTKKPMRLPLEDDDKEELPVKHSVSKLQVHIEYMYMCKII